jgi:predicted nucleic acid-binding protein
MDEYVHKLMPTGDFTVTGPDPSRAEMAMHIMAALASTEGLKKYHHMAEDAVAMADALIAALARKEKQ